MKAIVNVSPNRLEWSEFPVPKPLNGQVRIRTAACGICATDLHMISGWERISYPAIPGHEWAGIVDAVGIGVPDEWIGRPCVGENILADGSEIGFEHPGGYAEYFVTEAVNLHFLPEDFSLTKATLIEPLAVCLRGIKRLRLEDTRSAVVFGDGPIGLLMMYLLKSNGLEDILMVGGSNSRLEIATEFGADTILNYHELRSDLTPAILNRYPYGAANVIEASGAESSVYTSLNIADSKGKILLIGEYDRGSISCLLNHLLLNELEIIGSNASKGAWDDAVDMAVHSDFLFSKLISSIVPAHDYLQGMEMVHNHREMIKVVLNWMDQNDNPEDPIT